MATAREYFDKDSSRNLRVHASHTALTGSGESLEIVAALSYDFEAGVKYGLLYVPETSAYADIIRHYLDDTNELLKVGDGIEIATGLAGLEEVLHAKDLQFSRRIIAYTPTPVTHQERSMLTKFAQDRNLFLTIRDGNYIAVRASHEKPLAFISHDSRDKADLVRDLAGDLQKMLCSVWYDEYSLVAGSSLRASIERGIKECKKCVLVLSPNFLSNSGWTKAEFDSVFTREILDRKDVIIPIWHNVSQREVYDYSPRLADKVAISSSVGREEIARRVLRAINE